VELRFLQARSVLRDLARERWAWVALPAAAALVVAAARRLRGVETRGPVLACAIEVGIGAGLAWIVLRALRRADAGRTIEGPLGDLIVGGRREALWRCAQGAALLLPLLTLAAAGMAPDAPLAGLRLACAAAVGACMTAGLTLMGPVRMRSEGGAATRTSRTPRRVMKVASAAAILVVGTLAALAARRNNADPLLATAVLGLSGLGAGGTLGATDLALLRFLGHEPSPLASLLTRFAGLPALATAGSVALAGVLVGLSAPTVFLVASATALVVAAYAAATALHVLGGMGRFASTAAAVDLALLAAVAAASVPLAPVWAVARATLLTTAARRRRWLEC
jgi:hypothetical protein